MIGEIATRYQAPPIPVETVNRLLDATAQQIIGVVAVIVAFSVLIVLYALIRQMSLMSRQIENNTELIKENVLLRDSIEHNNVELHRQNIALDDQTLFLGRIEDNTKLQLATTEKIAASSDRRIQQNDETNANVTALRRELADGAKNAVTEVKTHMDGQFDTQKTLLLKLTSEIEGVKTILEADRSLTRETLIRVESKLDNALALLTKKPAAPVEPAPTSVDPAEKAP